ncbi:GAF domain-containing protein [Bradyrhizobium guangdongense]|uniref:GAF domain-containing protein n=1 Tax=Bradyrhizobium guangdongense TaxID=1325090 RepID=UPI00131A0294|nr:GAF domain-containing protein [Bradyrhizobium guangdongense]
MDTKSAASVRNDNEPLSKLEEPTTLLQDIVHGRDPAHAVNGLIANLARPDYSVTNLIHDVSDLKERIARSEPAKGRLLDEWVALDRVVGKCVVATTVSHEKFIESTSHAFCNFDQSGIIVSANQRMLELNPDCIGQPLTSYFDEPRKDLRAAIANGSYRPLDLLLRTRRGNAPMLVEFGKIHTDAGSGGYALLLDMSDRMQAERKALEAAPFGMLKLDARHRVVFATEKACELLETDLSALVGVDARDLLTSLNDRRNRRKVIREGIERRKGRGGEYDVVVKRPKSGQLTHIRVSSLPLFDDIGNFAGSIERLQPIDETVARDTLATLVATEVDYTLLYKDLIEVLRRFVEFDWANLFIYSPDRDYSRLVCTYGPQIQFESRWFPTPTGYKDWLEQADTSIADLSTFDPELLKSTDTQIGVKQGMRALVCLPVRHGGKPIGGLCLISKKPGLYNADTRLRLAGIMVEQALLPVLHLAERAESDFVTNLVQEISRIADLRELAKCVVEGLARFYQFHNVSIFKINVLGGYFKLLAQAIGSATSVRLPDGYQQPIADGLLGRCLAKGEYIILSDVKDSASDEARFYVSALASAGKLASSRSELCIPIRLFNRVLWILNIEDDRKDAFTPQEVQTLKRVIDQIQSVLERTFQNTILSQVLNVCPAGIVVTKHDHKILRCNREGLQMLQLDTIPEDEDLSRYLRIPLADLSSEPTTSTLIGASGAELPVQVSRFTLEEEYDHIVFLIEDVTDLKWSRNFAKIKAVLAETTAQARVPVSLLSSYIRRFGHQVEDEQLHDLTRKALRQLDRIELTYDRILVEYGKGSLPPAQASSFDIGGLIDHILADLPLLQRLEIKKPDTIDGTVSADPYRTFFALSSMLAYLLRCRSTADPITIAVSQTDGMVEVTMAGTVKQNAEAGDIATMVNTTRAEIGLARNAIARIAKNSGGNFRSRRFNGGEVLSLRLPAAINQR